jgi:hypothetical protein
MVELSGEKYSNAYDYMECTGQILDGYQYQFQLLRENAYRSIARKIDKLPKNINIAIRTPACIEWRGYNNILKDHKIIAEVIRPNRIVTLIDAEWKIKERLNTDYGKHVLKLIAHQKDLTIEKILQWLGTEVSVSEDWAEWIKFINNKPVKHLVLGISTPSVKNRKIYTQDVENLTKILTQPKIISFYASYSMTVASEKARKIINEAIWKLREYGVVIDPASIEIGGNIKKEEESVVFAYTVCRDLRWDVQKVDIVSAFHPYKYNPKRNEFPPLSTGMMDELGHARAFRKERYLVLTAGGESPFTKDNYVPAEHIYKTTNEFFDFVENKRVKKLKPQYKKITNAFKQWQRKQKKK